MTVGILGRHGIRRLGQQSAVKDPAKLSVLRSRLMQAGFYNREAPVIYLGVRAAALAVATLGVIMILPLVMGGKAGMLGVLVASVLAGLAILGPDRVLAMRKSSREREYADGFPDLLDLLMAARYPSASGIGVRRARPLYARMPRFQFSIVFGPSRGTPASDSSAIAFSKSASEAIP